MKKTVSVVLLFILTTGLVLGGNLVHNTNHSADFIRTMNRNASTGLDAVYFNPAGLTSLDDGKYFYFSNQTIMQDREVKSSFSLFGEEKKYLGSTFAPVFPNVYYVDKRGDFAFSLGLMPIGGGGSANFEEGLPSFEYDVAIIPTLLTASEIPTTAYGLDMAFEGSSVYLGVQANVSYKVSDLLSVSVGGRYVQAKNTYIGHLKDIQINPDASDIDASLANYDGTTLASATGFFTNLSNVLSIGAEQLGYAAEAAQGAGESLQPLVDDENAGNLTFDDLLTYGIIDEATYATLAGGAEQLGIPFDGSINTPNNTQPAFFAVATTYAALSEQYANDAATNAGFAAKTADIEVDATQNGSAFAPVLGLYYTPNDRLALSLRYEGKAEMTLVNDTEVDGSGLFPNGGKTYSDMPAVLATGLSFKVLPSLRLEGSYNLYFNEDVDWGGKEAYTENGFEYGLGAEFALSEALTLSGGWLFADGNVLKGYNSDMSNSLVSNTVGFGGKYKLNSKMGLSFGISNTFYEEGTETKDVVLTDELTITADETYMKTALDFAVGLCYAF